MIKIDHIRNSIGLILVLAVFILLLDKCSSYKTDTFEPGVIDIETIKDSMRTHYEHHRDTVFKTDTFSTNVPYIKEVPVYVEVHSDTPGMDLSDTNEFNIGMRTFIYQKKDSVLDYTIKVKSTERPENVHIDYNFKQMIIRDSVYVRDSISETTTKKVRVNQVYFGGEAIVYPGLSGVFAGADLINKRGWQFEVGVGILNDKTIAGKVGFKKLISFRNVKRN